MDPDSSDSDSYVGFENDTEPAFVLDYELVDSESTPGMNVFQVVPIIYRICSF